MNCRIVVVENFRREAKRLVKKFASLKDELFQPEKEILRNPRYGTPLDNDIYKIRLAVKSKGSGKSGGMRVITRAVEIQMQVIGESRQTDVYRLSIYDKAEQADISDKLKLKDLINDLIIEFEDKSR
ncbi:MAG: hypothetical protein LH472_10930 [Pyrinomonadaceae bacterium]|nr:hypothetical protein [Pyrinomonadaceae bacterium]